MALVTVRWDAPHPGNILGKRIFAGHTRRVAEEVLPSLAHLPIAVERNAVFDEEGRAHLTFMSAFAKTNGYTSTAEGLVVALDALGHVVSPVPFRDFLAMEREENVSIPLAAKEWLHPRMLELLTSGAREANKVGMMYGFPETFGELDTNYRIGFTMWESSRVPEQKIPHCNAMDELWVPCVHNREAFERSGVTVPIFILPLGYDPEAWPQVRRGKRKTFTFLIEAMLTLRKGWDIVHHAFHAAFDPPEKYPDVRLVMKSSRKRGIHKVRDDDERVKIIDEIWSQEKLLDLYHQADCFVYPSRGEGWGLGPLQAMATGLPVICIDWSGPADYLHEDYAYPITEYEMKPCKPLGLEGDGVWAEPDFDQVVALMRHVHENQSEARAKGRKAAKEVKKRFTFQCAAQQIVERLREIDDFSTGL